ASAFANFGFKSGTRIIGLLVSFRFRSSLRSGPQVLTNFGIGTLVIIAACLALSTGAALAQSDGGAVAKLKPEVTVSSELVRIGDLLDGAGAAADIAVFRAPDIGETGNVPAYRVLDAVRPYGVIVDTAGNTAIAVTRTGRVLGVADIEGAVA